MSSLHETQASFCAAMFATEDDTRAENQLLCLLDGLPDPLRNRLAAYRRNIYGNLCNALLVTYPIVAQLVGIPFFREAARNFIHAYPSHSGDLNDYGEQFSDFIRGYPHAAGLPYLGDVARLEWLVQLVRFAADTPTNALPELQSVLAQTPPDRYGELRFSLDATTARFDSSWPIGEIWRVHQSATANPSVDMDTGCQLLIRRLQAGDIEVIPLAAGDAGFLDALADSKPLADAMVVAQNTDPEFALNLALQHWVGSGVLSRACLDPPTFSYSQND